MVENRVRHRHVFLLIIRQVFRPTLELVRRIKAGDITIRMRGESHIGRHRASHRRVPAAKGVLEPESTTEAFSRRILCVIAAICQLIDIGCNNSVALEHFVEDASLK